MSVVQVSFSAVASPVASCGVLLRHRHRDGVAVIAEASAHNLDFAIGHFAASVRD